MRIRIEDDTLIVQRQKGDRHFRRSEWCIDPTHTIMYHVAKILNGIGFNLIKKRMAKDGHCVDDYQPYLRVRSVKSKNTVALHLPAPHIYITDPMWNIRDAAEELWKEGKVKFRIHMNVSANQPNCRELVAQLARILNKHNRSKVWWRLLDHEMRLQMVVLRHDAKSFPKGCASRNEFAKYLWSLRKEP